ncbi:acetyl-CoA carboxylase carboxyltransferase subunit alpha [Haloplasma contractile]|uniref:Acetyl-coenzyme A carboxylase carboxyl transferase subunit alpha n=1 Tax=Haloplasma contractile SSD-17B TaxID=1033810 RepID=U2E9B6_9MOLU|nr:acetyl-CoA carboxylase carboxyltransferase subunit alpha [Haloplasma contractile]ERJ11451.1 Acetyl-coenzyme A carboxylase carboxyl transferase subunit alpha protein [Haloplasma contractile SSD-17B]
MTNQTSKAIEKECEQKKTTSAWDRVKLARHPKRPTSRLFIKQLFTDFIELHGDRAFGDDKSIISGIGLLDDVPVTVIAQEKGINTEDKIKHNFGMPHPEGYRKALRLMKQAEKFNRPIITFIDTPGAYPGLGAEERGQAEAIARNLMEMANLKVPIITVVVSEGGSGGALAIGVSDRVLMLENAVYSILSPEGFATILWRDAKLAPKASELMKLTAHDLLEMGVVEAIIPEHNEGLHQDPEATLKDLKSILYREVITLANVETDVLLDNRYNKYRTIGVFGKEEI